MRSEAHPRGDLGLLFRPFHLGVVLISTNFLIVEIDNHNIKTMLANGFCNFLSH